MVEYFSCAHIKRVLGIFWVLVVAFLLRYLEVLYIIRDTFTTLFRFELYIYEAFKDVQQISYAIY